MYVLRRHRQLLSLCWVVNIAVRSERIVNFIFVFASPCRGKVSSEGVKVLPAANEDSGDYAAAQQKRYANFVFILVGK